MRLSFLKALIEKRPSRRRKAAGQTAYASRLVELLEERQLLAAANPVISIDGKSPIVLPQFNGQQYLAMVDATQTRLYTTTGTQAGTVQVATFPASMTLPLDTAVLNSELYFSAKGTAGAELWKTNGTTAGSVQVLDINPGTVDSSPAGFESLNGILYFAATTAASGRELWRTNGQAAGTTQVVDLVAGADSSSPIHLQAFDNHMFFGTGDRLSTWRTDGSQLGTVQLQVGDLGSAVIALPEAGTFPVGVVNGRLIVKRELQSEITLLSYSTAGATPDVIYTVPASNIAVFVVDQFAVVGNQMYFRQIPYLHGDKDWTADLRVTNGTAVGTTLVSGALFQKPPLQGVILPFPHGLYNDGGANKLVFRDTGSGPFFNSNMSWTVGTGLTTIPHDGRKMIGNFVQFGTEMFGLQANGLLRFDSGLTGTSVVPAYLDGLESPSDLVVMQAGVWFRTANALWKFDSTSPARATGPVITAPGAFVGPGAGQTFPSSVLVDWNDVAEAVGYDVIIGTEESNQVVRVTESQYTLPSVVIGTQTVRVRAVLSNGEITEASSHTFIGVAAPQNLSVSEFPLEQAIRVSTTDQSFSVLPNGNTAIVHILDGETNALIKSEQVFFPAGATREVRVGLLFTQVPGHHRLIVKVNSLYVASAPGTSSAFTMRTRSLDATFNTTTNVTLTWPAVAGVLNYDVWVDDDVNKIRGFVQAPNLITNSYTGNFPASTYRAWVRARFSGGAVTPWSIASGFTTGGTMRLMNPSGTILDDKGDELFVLSEVKDATGYEIWVNNVTTGARVLHDANIPVDMTSWLPPTSLGPGHYAAWARPKLAGNTHGPWSPVRNFTIQASRQIAVTSPSGPVFDRTPDVAWQTVPWATSYTLYVAVKGASTAAYRVNLPAAASSHTIVKTLADGDYDVWVQARGANGLISPWGPAKLMTIGFGRTNALPSLGANRTLNWAPVAGATHYDLWVDYLDPSGPIQSQIIRRSDLTANSFVLPNTLFAGPYRAWVRAIRMDGSVIAFTSNWSAQGLFAL